MQGDGPKRRADIRVVGIAEAGVMSGWQFVSGDVGHYVAADAPDAERFGGWSYPELHVIAVLWRQHQFPLPIEGALFGPPS